MTKPNLNAIKADLGLDVPTRREPGKRAWITQGQGEALVAALEAVREESFDTLVKYEGHPEPYRFGLADQASATLDLINRHLTIGDKQ